MKHLPLVAVLLCLVQNASGRDDSGLPIAAQSFPGYFEFAAGNDVLDDPPSVFIQVGDGRVLLGTPMTFTTPIEPRQEMSMPYVDSAGNFIAQPATMDLGGMTLHFDTPPTGTLLLQDGVVNVSLAGNARIVMPMADGSTFELARPVIVTTGQAAANADGLDKLLLFGNTIISGTPFNPASGAGAIVTAFTIPKDLPQAAVDQLTAVLAGLGLPADGSAVLGVPMGVRITGTLTEANAAKPQIEPNGGTFIGSVAVSITSATAGAAICCTTDGTPPTASSTPYAGPFILTSNVAVTAKTFAADHNGSDAVAASFTLRVVNGDVNEDCKVNVLDLLLVRNKLGQDTKTGDAWKADVNKDGKINVLDLVIVRNNLSRACQ